MRKVFIKYNVMRVRMKISLSALININTINEHWLKQIAQTFRFLRDSDQIKVPNLYTKDEEEILK